MRRIFTLTLGLAGSVILHAAAGYLYLATRTLDDAPHQIEPRSQMQMDTVTASMQKAKARRPESETVSEARANSAVVGAGNVPSVDARPTQLEMSQAASLMPQAKILSAQNYTATPLSADELRAEGLTQLPTDTVLAPEAIIETQNLVTEQSGAITAPAEQPEVQKLADEAPIDSDRLHPEEAFQIAPAELSLPATKTLGMLAWQFGDRVVTDPQALETIQAFMSPQSLDDPDRTRDNLESVLTDVDCARLSATFIPETGALEIRGHIPDPAFRVSILEAMQKQVGGSIPVTTNLLHLPSPLCDVLTGIASVGLPQSTDQFTNERLVGETAHAREYTYSDGQRLQFDLVAPDYDAYIYVDYFTAAGEVIHLVPNQTISLQQATAKSVFGVGQDRVGESSLRITIAPPFGQEIAVAFAASQPLYDGLRPTVEAAEAYLNWLQTRVAKTRDVDPEFKGEWVYFFITTRPATQ